MTWSEFFSAVSLIASVVTIYLTHQNKKDQRDLEKEIQQNEFNFSLKNLWYQGKAEAIDELIGNLSTGNRIAGTLLNNTEISEEKRKEIVGEINDYVGKYNMRRHYIDDEEILEKYRENVEIVIELSKMVRKKESKSNKKELHDKFMENGSDILSKTTSKFL